MAETGVAIGNVILTGRELAAVLAGLRVYQAGGLVPWYDVYQIATRGGMDEPLTPEEVGDLCERLNCGG